MSTYPMSSANFAAVGTPMTDEQLFELVKYRTVGSSVLQPDPRMLLSFIPNIGREMRHQLGYYDAKAPSQALNYGSKITFFEGTAYNRLFYSKQYIIAEQCRRYMPDVQKINKFMDMYRRHKDGEVAQLLRTAFAAVLGDANDQIADFYPETPSAAPTTIKRSRAADGWIDLTMPATGGSGGGPMTISDYNSDTKLEMFTGLFDLMVGIHPKGPAAEATPGVGPIVFADSVFFNKFANSLVYRNGSPNIVLNNTMYQPLAARAQAGSYNPALILPMFVGDRTWGTCLLGQLDAMGTPGVLQEFLRVDPNHAGYSEYPVFMAGDRNTWYITSDQLEDTNTQVLSNEIPSTLVTTNTFMVGACRMPGNSQGALWGRIRNTALLDASPQLNLYAMPTPMMMEEDIDKFYVDAGLRDTGREMKSEWNQARSMAFSSTGSDAMTMAMVQNVSEIEKTRGSTMSHKTVNLDTPASPRGKAPNNDNK